MFNKHRNELVFLMMTAAIASTLNIPAESLSMANTETNTTTISLASGFLDSISAIALPPLSNSSIQADTIDTDSDTAIACYHTSSGAGFYRPIVLEDCYPSFGMILLSFNVLSSRAWIPRSGRRTYRRQNGNCVFEFIPGPSGASIVTSEIAVAIELAKIVKQCVTPQMEYLGGGKMFSAKSDWLVTVSASGSPSQAS